MKCLLIIPLSLVFSNCNKSEEAHVEKSILPKVTVTIKKKKTSTSSGPGPIIITNKVPEPIMLPSPEEIAGAETFKADNSLGKAEIERQKDN